MTTPIRGLWDKCQPYRMVWASRSTGRNASVWHSKPELISAVRGNDGPAQEIIRRSYKEAKASIRASLPSGQQS